MKETYKKAYPPIRILSSKKKHVPLGRQTSLPKNKINDDTYSIP